MKKRNRWKNENWRLLVCFDNLIQCFLFKNRSVRSHFPLFPVFIEQKRIFDVSAHAQKHVMFVWSNEWKRERRHSMLPPDDGCRFENKKANPLSVCLSFVGCRFFRHLIRFRGFCFLSFLRSLLTQQQANAINNIKKLCEKRIKDSKRSDPVDRFECVFSSLGYSPVHFKHCLLKMKTTSRSFSSFVQSNFCSWVVSVLLFSLKTVCYSFSDRTFARASPALAAKIVD